MKVDIPGIDKQNIALKYRAVSHFDWEYRDDKKQYHIDQNLTPQSFFEKYVGWNLDDCVSIINAPTDD
ncbi:C1 family peptidase, partial [Klebsiella pneumoniae]|nr:C1 family peptidase [Klebsiella pneumoniae]